MVDYYKQARRWEREHEARKRAQAKSPARELNFSRDKSTGEFKLPPKRNGGSVPSSGPINTGIRTPPDILHPQEKIWKDLPSGASGRGRFPSSYRGLAGGVLGWMMSNADNLAQWGRDDWDKFMDDGTLPPGLDILNPPDDVRDEWMRKHFGTPIPLPTDGFITSGELYDRTGSRGTISLLGLRMSVPAVPGDYTFNQALPARLAAGETFSWYNYFYAGVKPPVVWGGVGLDTFADMKQGKPVTGWPSPTKHWILLPDNPPGQLATLYGYSHGNQLLGAYAKNGTPLATYPTGGTVPRDALLPTGKTISYLPNTEYAFGWAPDPNDGVPMRYAKFYKMAQILAGNRYDSGYVTDEQAWTRTPSTSVTVDVTRPGGGGYIKPPTVITKPSEPYKPPGSKNDRKAMVRGKALFLAAQRGFHALTEYNDFIESFYDALPKKYQTCKIGGPACKTARVLQHWEEVDIPTAVVNWIWNDFEDRMIGKFNRSVDNAARKLGTRDWKLLNSYADSPLDEGLGELYGEFLKEHVNPRKEDFVKWSKEHLL